jgi:BASS family bile acid:Na+ symporter
MLMLGLMLVVAGLGARRTDLTGVFRHPGKLIAGVAANTVYPVMFTLVVGTFLTFWYNGDKGQNVVVGLAMVGAMPIAGSSTTWSQNADGNLGLSLGLVWASTLLSPLITPAGLHAIALFTRGDYSKDLHELASQGSGAFVVIAVVLPSLLGVALQFVLPAALIARVMPALKLLNLVDLLALNYSNAAAALPQAVAHPDWGFLGLVATLTTGMCVGAFTIGWAIARLFRAGGSDRTALMFGLGLNNNGTALVLAAAALADHPLVLLPIIFYNLVQQIVAGAVHAMLRRV